jgi:hypothetical protein
MQKPQPRGWGFRFGGKPTSRHRLIAGRVEERRPAMRLPAIERSPEFIRGDVISRRTQPVHHSASQSGPAVRARIPDNCPRLHHHRSEQLGRTVLLSRAFDAFVESDFDLERVGEYPVRGFNDPISVPTTTLKH